MTERWIGDPTLTWIGLCKSTTMAEGDIYRLLARTLEFLSQLHTLKATHPGLAESASRAIAALRRGVLEEFPDDVKVQRCTLTARIEYSPLSLGRFTNDDSRITASR